MAILSASEHGPQKAKEIARAMDVPARDYVRFKKTLRALERSGKVYRVKGNRFGVSKSLDLVPGVVSITRAGDGFVQTDAEGPDVFVPARRLGTGMAGDRVMVRIEGRPRGRSPVGSVIKVLERAHETVVGTFHHGRRFDFVASLDRRFHRDVLIPDGSGGAAESGDVVVVRIDSFGEGNIGPAGTVTSVVGPITDPGVDVLAVALGFRISLDFPQVVLDAAAAAAEAGVQDLDDRIDRTGLLVLTIDPADAKDHDDALSAERLPSGLVEVGVHIADVSYFVPEGGAVDAEAKARGTSVYLVDRTVPMLPAALSAEACSLHEGDPRAALSLFMEMDSGGRVVRHRFERTLVQVRTALSYEQAQSSLDGANEPTEIDATLRSLSDIALAVRAERRERGALELDLPEAKVILNDQGEPIDIQRRSRLESHRLVEDFMVLANEVVAGACESRGLAALFRVHEPPPPDRITELRDLLSRLGHRLPGGARVSPGDVQHLLETVRGRPEEALVSTVVLRSLAKARYEARNLGHFGLASGGYLHFTSPIRRYPDLVVHRAVVRAFIEGKDVEDFDIEALQSVGDHASEREQAAANAERASVALKKVEFMERHLGEDFDGKISGVAAFGFFVTLERFFVEGLVHVNSLRDDFYRLHQEQYALVGERGRRRYRIGDPVRVQVARVDKEARHVDFVLIRKRVQPD